VADTVDPLGGAFCVEHLTDEMERKAQAYIDQIDNMGGAVAAIEQGFVQKEIQESAYAYQRAVESGERVVVGLNKFQEGNSIDRGFLRVDPTVRESQMAKLEQLKSQRDNTAVGYALEKLKVCAQGTDNLMGPIMEAVKRYATLGEICYTLRSVFGEYRPVSTL
jgi:methylmalonyl-CoA mutase N-terminal domain/subunit